MLESVVMRSTARAMLHGLADLLLPRSCAVCEHSIDAGDTSLVCGRCWARAHELPHPRCDRCGHPQTRPSWPADVVAERSMVMPVPLAPIRERERGFNQSALALTNRCQWNWHDHR